MHHRAAGALLVLLAALAAGAQAPEVNLSLFRPASGGDGTLGVEGARPLGEGSNPIELQLLLDGALNPVRPPPPRIDRRLGGWISMQGRVDSRFSLSVQIPVTLREDGNLGPPSGTLPGAGLGDVRVGVRGALLATPDVALAAQAAVELATSQQQALTGDGRLVVEALLSGSRRLSDRMELLGNALVRFRPPRDLGTARLGNEIGLRGAGKSTLGSMLAKDMKNRFVELDGEIEKDTGMPLGEIFSLYGQSGFRAIEKRTLERVLKENERAVISVGGGVVSEKETFDYLLSNCYAVWIKAQPEEHMSRVKAQGDFRAMAGNDQAMEDLRRILESREPLYRKADLCLDTSASSVEESFAKLKAMLQANLQ